MYVSFNCCSLLMFCGMCNMFSYFKIPKIFEVNLFIMLCGYINMINTVKKVNQLHIY